MSAKLLTGAGEALLPGLQWVRRLQAPAEGDRLAAGVPAQHAVGGQGSSVKDSIKNDKMQGGVVQQ